MLYQQLLYINNQADVNTIHFLILGRQDRELTEEERSLGSIGYIGGSLGYLPEHHFEENGTGYPLWKPSFYSRGEAPPPYEEALAAARAEAALARVPGNNLQYDQFQLFTLVGLLFGWIFIFTKKMTGILHYF